MSFIFVDFYMEEGEFGAAVFSPEEARPPVLLVHTILRDSTADHVHTRGTTSYMGHLLCTSYHVHPKHSSLPKILPLCDTVSPF